MGPEVRPTGEESKQPDEELQKTGEIDEPSQEREEFKSESLAFVTQDSDGRCKYKDIFYTQPDGTVSIRECKMVFRDRTSTKASGWEDAPFSYRNLQTPTEVLESLKSKLDGSWHLVGPEGKEQEVSEKTRRIGYEGIDERLKKRLKS